MLQSIFLFFNYFNTYLHRALVNIDKQVRSRFTEFGSRFWKKKKKTKKTKQKKQTVGMQKTK